MIRRWRRWRAYCRMVSAHYAKGYDVSPGQDATYRAEARRLHP